MKKIVEFDKMISIQAGDAEDLGQALDTTCHYLKYAAVFALFTPAAGLGAAVLGYCIGYTEARRW